MELSNGNIINCRELKLLQKGIIRNRPADAGRFSDL